MLLLLSSPSTQLYHKHSQICKESSSNQSNNIVIKAICLRKEYPWVSWEPCWDFPSVPCPLSKPAVEGDLCVCGDAFTILKAGRELTNALT